MILNIVNKSPNISTALTQCLAQLADGDALLFTEDGVLATLDAPSNQEWLALCPRNITLYVLQEDLAARGVLERVLPEFQQVDYGEWVDLVARYSLNQSWF